MTASIFLPLNNFSSSDRLYNCFAISLMVFGRENWSHQLEMSRNACRRVRSERDVCPREAARCSSRAIPEPPSRKLMRVSSCSMPSMRGSIAAPTRDGSSPSSFANVLWKRKLGHYALCMMRSGLLTRHSLRVSTIRSPKTSPQPPHTRSPLLNSSTIFGFGSRHSGQISRMFRSGPNVCAFG